MKKTTVLGVEHIELTQTIQSPENDVFLISDKDIYVRIYFESNVSQQVAGSHSGSLVYTINNGDTKKKISLNCINFNSRFPTSIVAKRRHWKHSLNFIIPRSELSGELNLKIHTININDSGKDSDDSYVADLTKIKKEFKVLNAPDLKIRVLAIRYRGHDGDEFLEPSDVEIDVVRRRLNALYPIKELSRKNGNWSSVRISANEPFRAMNPAVKWSYDNEVIATKVMSELFKQIMSHRTMEVQFGDIDSRTIYLGLITDPSGIYGGAAMDSPEYAASHVTAISSTDSDGSLAAHELAHVFGLHHPGVPDRAVYGDALGQKRIEPPNAGLVPHGFISLNSDVSKVHYGLDPSLSKIEPAVLSNTEYFDLMTYRYPQWISKYSYQRLFERLTDIENSPFRIEGTDESWTVICEYDIDQKEGEISHVVKGSYLTAGADFTIDDRNEIVANFQDSLGSSLIDDQLPKIEDAIDKYADIDLLRIANAFENMNDEQRQSVVTSFRSYSQVLAGDRSTSSHVSNETIVDRQVREAIFPARPLEIHLEYEYTDEDGDSIPRSDEVNYRHSRLADRHPHGVLQHTIKIPSRAKSLNYIRLIVAGNVVDGVDDPTEKSWIVAEKIRKLSNKRNRSQPGAKSRKSPLVRFNYDIQSDRYVFRYSWNNIQAGKDKSTAPITTSLLARRVLPSTELESGQWEVIHVGRSLKDRVLVSKEFVSIEDRVGAYSKSQQKKFEDGLLNSTVYTRHNDKLEFKLLATVGFDTSHVLIDSLVLDSDQNSHQISASISPPKKLKRKKEYSDEFPNLEDRFVKMFSR